MLVTRIAALRGSSRELAETSAAFTSGVSGLNFGEFFTREDYIVQFDFMLAQNALLLGAQPTGEPDTDRHIFKQDYAYCCQPN